MKKKKKAKFLRRMRFEDWVKAKFLRRMRFEDWVKEFHPYVSTGKVKEKK